MALTLEQVEQRINEGEAYLAQHPNDTGSLKVYLAYCERYGDLGLAVEIGEEPAKAWKTEALAAQRLREGGRANG